MSGEKIAVVRSPAAQLKAVGRRIPSGSMRLRFLDFRATVREVRSVMAQYSVYVFCNDCGDVHPMGISIQLDDGPPRKESIGNLYDGIPLPPEIATLIHNKVQCPKTGKLFVQRDNRQVFLVADPT